ncbi:MAG: 4Fe-4S ferredoxin iron-sulfur binding domain-containing protein [Promethearchaeota archaeon CR_4]|nr:MAG: 4Fe-4S ferredoxin iron-sulfur binding domain-containing protein [Candidatus Lokiarchaeota archaeon CR_4]
MKLCQDEFKRLMTEEIERMVREDTANRFEKLNHTLMYQTPLVGFVSGTDPLFSHLKQVIGNFHSTPVEAITQYSKLKGVTPPPAEHVGVISYILPISQATRDENAGMKDHPSRRWAYTRLFGQDFNNRLQSHLVEFLEQRGFIAVAPEQDKRLFKQLQDEKVGWASTWSQRHVAYAAGLGTFGLSDGLITSKGKAHRIGSVVVNFPLESPARPTDIHQYCVFYQTGGCMICAQRCPAGAITDRGHDKNLCKEFVYSQLSYIQQSYGIKIYACGLCQTKVACEKQIPNNQDK